MKQVNIQSEPYPNDRYKLSLITDAFTHLSEIFFCTDDQGKILNINTCGSQFLHSDEEQLTGKLVVDIHSELTPERWSTAAVAAKKKGQWIIQFEQSQYTKKQSTLEISLNHHPINDKDYYICTTKVISKINHSDQLLNMIAQATATYSGQKFFDVLVQNMAKVMHVRHAFITECMDQPHTRVRMLALWYADQPADNLEYDLEGTPCDTVINGKQNYLVKNNMGEEFPKEKGFAESYYGIPIYNVDGVEVIGHMAFLDDEDLSIDGIDCTVFEILASRASVEIQRLHAQIALQKSESNYRLLVENQTDLIIRLDNQGDMAFVSPSCCTRLGKEEDELLNNNFFKLIHNSEANRAKKAWQQAFQPPYKSRCELRTLTSQGWCWFNWILKGINDKDDNVNEVIAVGRNISERVRAEDQTRETIHQLAHVGRVNSMGEMASSIAHELNQPLTAILSFSQASQRMLTSDKETDLNEYKKILERISANAELAGNIIQRVRGFVRKNEPVHSSIDLNILIHDVFDLLSTELRHGDIKFSLMLDEELPLISGDPIQIQQVLVNLIRNGIEAINEHNAHTREITIVAKTEQVNAAAKINTMVVVEVIDSGPGIPAGIQEQLFNAFITTKDEGLGIGLSICHTILEAHGGTLSVKSSPGKGAKFTFTLPAFKEE